MTIVDDDRVDDRVEVNRSTGYDLIEHCARLPNGRWFDHAHSG